MTRLTDNTGVRVAAKLAVTAGMIAAIAFAIMQFGESTIVPETRADILDLSGAVDDQRSFRNALDALGHEQPQTYVVNGNEVRVSTAKFDVTPRRAVRAYQRQFVRHGLNERTFDEISYSNSTQRMRASIAGGVVPAVISPDRVVMRGAMMRGDVDDYATLFSKQFGDGEASGMAQLFDGFRWVELHRTPKNGGATAVAMWSGEDFDYDRMFPDALESRLSRAQIDLPTCPNCQLVHQFSDPDRPKKSQSYLFVSKRTPKSLARHFESRCDDRASDSGPDPSKMLDELRRRVDQPGLEMRRISCNRGDRRVDLRIYPTKKDRTAVRMELRPREQSNNSPAPR